MPRKLRVLQPVTHNGNWYAVGAEIDGDLLGDQVDALISAGVLAEIAADAVAPAVVVDSAPEPSKTAKPKEEAK